MQGMEYVNVVSIVSKLQVVEDRGLGQITELGAIFNTIELDGVHAVNFVIVEDLLRLIGDQLDDGDRTIFVINNSSLRVATMVVGN